MGSNPTTPTTYKVAEQAIDNLKKIDTSHLSKGTQGKISDALVKVKSLLNPLKHISYRGSAKDSSKESHHYQRNLYKEAYDSARTACFNDGFTRCEAANGGGEWNNFCTYSRSMFDVNEYNDTYTCFVVGYYQTN